MPLLSLILSLLHVLLSSGICVERLYYDGVRRVQEVYVDPTLSMSMAMAGEGGPALAAAANQIELNAEEELDGSAAPGSLENQSLSGDQQGITLTYLAREYVWGPGDWGVDELLVQYGVDRRASWPLHDAGGDVVALCDRDPLNAAARVVTQWTYDAYGNVVGRDNPVSPASTVAAELHLGHKGLFFDRLDAGVIDPLTGAEMPRLVAGADLLGYNRNRSLKIKWGRFVQNDPNATGLVVQGKLAFQGVPIRPSVQDVYIGDHYGDSPNVLEYCAGDPISANDPSGLFLGIAGQGVMMGLNAWDFANDTLDTAATGLRGGFGLATMISDYMTWQEEDIEWASDWGRSDVDNYAGNVAGEAYGMSFDDGEEYVDDQYDDGLVIARGLHLNSTKSRAKSHGYQIDYFNPKTQKWEVWKYGISARGTNKAGISKRAQYQVNKLSRNPGHRAHGKKFLVSATQLRQFNSRRQALAWERDMVRQRGRPPGMTRPRRRKKASNVRPMARLKPSSKYWVGINFSQRRIDDRTESVLMNAERRISYHLQSSRVLHRTPWKGMTFNLLYYLREFSPERYKCEWSVRDKLLHFTLSVSDPVIKKLTTEQYEDDVVRSFLEAIYDALRRRKFDTEKLASEIKSLPRPSVPSAFINLLGDVRKECEPDDLSGLEVVLVVPLQGKMPSMKELNELQSLDDVIARAMRKTKAGEFDTREVGQGTAEYMVACEKSGPAVEVFRQLARDGRIPPKSKLRVRNLDTDTERGVVLRPSTA